MKENKEQKNKNIEINAEKNENHKQQLDCEQIEKVVGGKHLVEGRNPSCKK